MVIAFSRRREWVHRILVSSPARGQLNSDYFCSPVPSRAKEFVRPSRPASNRSFSTPSKIRLNLTLSSRTADFSTSTRFTRRRCPSSILSSAIGSISSSKDLAIIIPYRSRSSPRVRRHRVSRTYSSPQGSSSNKGAAYIQVHYNVTNIIGEPCCSL